MRFFVHSTFRDAATGRRRHPHGLEWNLDGDSHLYYIAEGGRPVDDITAPDVRRGVLEAHNRWLFAKDLPFRRLQDILTISRRGLHLAVEWKDEPRDEHVNRLVNVHGMLEKLAAEPKRNEFNDIWINGERVAEPLNLDTLEAIRGRLPGGGTKLCAKHDDGLLRIDRYFRGAIRGEEVFHHILDNLYALEDPEIVDAKTLIGTATVPDWIMGGDLTSRLWVQERDNGDILFLRPLYNDNTESSDRKYRLRRGKDDGKIAKVQQELERIRFLATIQHPLAMMDDEEDSVVSTAFSTEREKQHKKNRRRFFGL